MFGGPKIPRCWEKQHEKCHCYTPFCVPQMLVKTRTWEQCPHMLADKARGKWQIDPILPIYMGLDTYLIHIQTRTPLWRYPPYDYSEITGGNFMDITLLLNYYYYLGPGHLKPVILKPAGRMSILGEFDLPGMVPGALPLRESPSTITIMNCTSRWTSGWTSRCGIHYGYGASRPY